MASESSKYLIESMLRDREFTSGQLYGENHAVSHKIKTARSEFEDACRKPDSKWIRVEDRLPPNDEDVLVWGAWTNNDGFWCRNATFEKGLWYSDSDRELEIVTYWQPMPEGPTE